MRITSVFRPFLFIIYFFWDKTVKSISFTYPCSQNILELYRYWCHQKSPHGTSLLPNHNELYRGNCDPSNTFGSFALKSCRVRLGHPGNAYTRYTVLDHCLSKQLGKHCIKHEKKCFFSDFHAPRSNISNTRGSVSSDIQTPRTEISDTKRSVSVWYPNNEKWYIKHQKECFIWYLNTEKLYQTQEEVFFRYPNTGKWVWKTRASTFNQLFEVYFILNRAYLIHASLNPLSYKRRTYNRDYTTTWDISAIWLA